MLFETIFADDDNAREDALLAVTRAPEHERSALAGKLGVLAKDAADTLAAAGAVGGTHLLRFSRAVVGLSLLRVEIAKSALVRIADEGTTAVKAALARALRETTTPEGRAVLVHLLADDDVRSDAILAIGAAPWPEVLPILIEIAEADDHSTRIGAKGIAKCGATAGSLERNAASDFLLEQLDDDAVIVAVVEALLRYGRGFPGVLDGAKRIAKEGGKRKALGVCLAAAAGLDENATLLELALSGAKTDEPAARAFLGPLLTDQDNHVRQAAERTWKALNLA